MINTVFRQISFYFQRKIHEYRSKSELSDDDISDIVDTQKESLGNNVKLTDDYRSYWAYIPSFYSLSFLCICICF